MRFITCAAILSLSSSLIGQAPPASQEPETVFSGSLGVDFTSQYFFRAIQQENQGAIVQPWYELSIPLSGSEGLLHDFTLTVGSWNSLHDGPTSSGGPGATTTMWYESDAYAGLSFGIGEKLAANVVYTAYSSPNGTWSTVQEVSGSLGFDDTGFVFDSGLQPSVVLAFETDGSMETGPTGNEGIYGQIGIEPSFPLGSDVTLSVPLTAGFGLGDYYEFNFGAGFVDDSFGFVDVGVNLSMPLGCMPSRLGAWDASFGLHYLTMGDNMEALNGGDADEFIFSFGLSTSF